MSAAAPDEVQVRKSIFILKAKPQGLRSAENFLRNRSWDLRPTTDVKMALMTLLKDPVDYVLVGVDHANPSIVKLPDALMQSLKVPIILFAESMTAQSSLILRSSRYPYVLFPPVSGPSIERMLLKIEKEKNQSLLEKSQAESMAQNQNSFANQDGAKVFSGESLLNGSNMMMPTSSETHSLNKSTSSPQNFSQNHSQNQSSNDDFSTGFAQHNGSGGLSQQHYHPSQSSMLNPTPNTAGGASGFGSGNSAGASSGTSALDPRFSDDRRGPTISSTQQHNERSGDNASMSTGLLLPQDLLLMPENDDEKLAKQYQSLFSNCTVEALRMVCQPNSLATGDSQLIVEPVVPIRRNSNIACFEVDSATVSGVVVVAFGTDRAIDEEFSTELRDHIIGYMGEQGMELTMNDRVLLNVRQIEFEAWSMAEASFLHKTVHRGDEIALSFFINSDLRTPLEISDDNKMLKMSIDHLRVEVVLDFDVYLHMPVNRKYVRYVGKQGKLSLNQWDRLTAKGVSEIHVQKAAAPSVQRYRLQNFINDTVDAYHERKKTGS